MRQHSYAVNDTSRFVKAKKVKACLEYVCDNLQDKEVLEIGCGSGIIALELSKTIKRMTALDITEDTLKDTMQKYGILELPFQFVIGDGTKLTFPEASFDIVICNQVYEHVINQQKLIDEVYRVLKPSGICYIATPNKLWPIEPHTKLPFLSCLPKLIADKYIKIFRGIDGYDINLPTYWKLKRILFDRFDKVIDLTSMTIKNPQQFYIRNGIPKPIGSILTKMPMQILRILVPFSPSWVIIAIKS